MTAFKPNPEHHKKYVQKQIDKQRRLFLALCSETDIRIIKGIVPMTPEDFDRLYVLISDLGLTYYELDFYQKHEDIAQIKANQIMEEIDSDIPVNINKELQLRQEWYDDFCNQLPSIEMQKKFHVIFQLS